MSLKYLFLIIVEFPNKGKNAVQVSTQKGQLQKRRLTTRNDMKSRAKKEHFDYCFY